MAKKSTAVIRPNLGLYFNTTPLDIPFKGLADGLNFRVQDGKLTNFGIGWARFGSFTLNGPVRLIDRFGLRDNSERLIFCTPSDIYYYNTSGPALTFLTPIYSDGTVEVSAADPAVVTGTATTFTTNVAVGDQIAFTDNDEDDPDATWYEVAIVTDDTHLTLTTAVAGAPIAAGQQYTVRKLFNGDYLTHWDTDVFLNDPSHDDLWFATNGVDDIVKWDGVTKHASYSTVGIKAKHLLVYDNMMLYFNIEQGGESLPLDMINSDIGAPEDIVSGLSEQFTVHDGPDQIIDAKVLGDNVAIYFQNSVVLMQFVGDPLVFVFRKAISGVGPLAEDAVADFGNFHQFIGSDTLYKFDGANLEGVGDHVWRTILLNRDAERISLTFSHFDNEKGELVWAVPLAGDTASGASSSVPVNYAWGEHYLEDIDPRLPVPFSKRSFPFTAAGAFKATTTLRWSNMTMTWDALTTRWNEPTSGADFPINLVGDMNGKIYTLGGTENADGVALPSFVEFGRFAPGGDGRMRPLINRIYPFASSPDAGSTLDVTLLLADNATGAYTDSEVMSYDLDQPEGEFFVAPYRRGRFVALRFGADGPDQSWYLSGYDYDVRGGGFR